MSTRVRAVFEHGVFRPLERMPDFPEGDEVILDVFKPLDLEALRRLRGTLSDEDAEVMKRVIQEGRRVEGTW